MSFSYKKLYIINKFNLALYVTIIVLLSTCAKEKNAANNNLKAQFQLIDSLIIASKGDSAILLLERLRPQIKLTNPLICKYYRIQSEHNQLKPPLMELYADSALLFFATDKNISKYPEEFLETLLAKGNASIIAKKYNTALDYYDKAKKRLATGTCDDGQLAAKIAGIYFAQKNYHLAAQYWTESYRRLGACNATLTPQNTFFLKQAALNNAGFSYEQDGQLDSALYYYKEDLNCINKADNDNIIDKFYIRAASVVVYDNLGGINLKQGNLILAESFLNTCLNIPVKDVDGMRIPPLLKLAELYIKTGRYTKATAVFANSKALLDRFSEQNKSSEVNWNRLYAEYLFKMQQPGKAYQYQSTYVSLKDSLDNSSSKIYRLDIARELNAMHQQQELAELKQQEKLRQLYLVLIIAVAIILAAIIVLINNNFQKNMNNYTIDEANQYK